jgi:hypothetical protein
MALDVGVDMKQLDRIKIEQDKSLEEANIKYQVRNNKK